MGAPACWLISNDSNSVNGKRITACDWDTALSGIDVAEKAGREIGWPELASKPRVWQQ
jgi:hypothetical protein